MGLSHLKLFYLFVIVSTILLVNPQKTFAAQSGIVAEYGFNETTGATVTDSSGNNNNGTVNGASRVGGKFANGLNFNGTNQSVTIPDANSLDLTTGMTLEAWAKPANNTGWRTAILKETSGNLVYALYSNSDNNRPQTEIFNNGSNHSVKGTAVLTLNNWNYISATYDGTNLRYYLNGVLKSTLATSGPIVASTGPLRIGGNSVWSEYFSGVLDEIRVYNRALSASEITTDMNTAITLPIPDTTSPTVSMTAPADGSSVSGATVAVSANAADNVGVTGVQFKLDGNNLGAEDTTSPYTINWDTIPVTNGTHTITALAKDAANNTTTSSTVNVTVNNPPHLIILSPTAGQNISGTSVTVTYTSTGDQSQVNHVHFRLDGGATVMDLQFTGSYTLNNVPAGNHSLLGILARVDHSEIVGSDFTVNFITTTPDTTLPTVQITAPVQDATVSATLNVTANASDNVGVAGVQFKIDGNNLGAEDTSSPYSVSWNTSTIGNGPHILTAVARDAAANISTSTVNVNVFNNNSPDQIGQWTGVMNWPNVAVHTSLLDSGKVLFWDAWVDDPNSRVWDPISNTFANAPNPGGYFCSGHSQLPDGKILVMGGHNDGGGALGINRSTTFDPVTSNWTALPNMGTARWYPSSTRLSDGRILVIGGITSNNLWGAPEIYNPNTSTWTTMNLNYNEENDDEYPLSFYLPNGKIFTIAATTGHSYLLDVANQAKTSFGPPPNNTLGSAAQFRPGKILYVGGGDTKESNHPTSTQTAVIDFNQPTPTWRNLTPMQNGRYEFAMTVSADGKVYAMGGASVVSQTTSNGTTTLESWDPDTEGWATMAPMTDRRMYHSTSLLLPDGRILSAGGGRLNAAPNFLSAQVYSPPYFFKGPRPTITNAPSAVDYAQTITVDTPDAQNISKISFIPLASNTHTLDMNQTYMELNFTKNTNNLSVQIPTDNKIATPGYYMMFIINSNGVPSVSRIMKLNVLVDLTPPAVSMTAPVDGATVIGTTVAVSADATDNIGLSSVQFLLDGNNLANPDTSSPYTINWDTTTIANGPHNLSAKAIDTSGNIATSSAVAVTVNNPPDTTPPVITNINATNIATSSAQINWTSDENADSQVEYGLTTSYGAASILDLTLTKNHLVPLSGLTANTTYHYIVKSKDASGNLTTSGDNTLTTPLFVPTTTVDFNNATGQDVALNGQYPTGVINWGTNVWYLSAPWGQFTTKNISFNGSGITSAPFNFVTPKVPVSIQAFNGGTVASTMTLSCTGNPTVTSTVAVNALVTIPTNWANACTTVTVTSSNGWNTNFDNLVIQ